MIHLYNMQGKYVPMFSADENILNGINLNIKSVIGIDSTAFTKAIQFNTQETLIYSSGPHIVTQDLSSGKFDCQSREESDSQVTLLKVIHEKERSKSILGEAFSKNFPTLSYQDPEQSHMLIHQHLTPSDHIIEAAISKDTEICYTLSHVFISAWLIKTHRLISYTKIPPGIRKLEILPEDNKTILLGGLNYLKYWQLYPERKAIEEQDQYLYTETVLDMQFVPGSNVLLVLCSNSKILIFEKNISASGSLNYNYQTLNLRNKATCMAVSSQECLVGCDTEIDTYLIDKSVQLHFSNVFKLPIKSGIVTCAAYSPDEGSAVIMVKIEGNVEVFILETAEFTVTRPFGTSLTCSEVKGLSVSTGKELVCSYGLDKTVRVWMYFRHCKGIAEQQFTETPCAVAIHPTGYQIAVGFENSIKIFYLLYNSFSHAFGICKRCESIAYSPCGKYLAFGQNNSISIFDPYTLTALFTLQGHTGVPVHLKWKKEILTSVCSHGTVHIWKLNEKLFDFSSTDYQVRQAVYDETLDLLACIHYDGGFRVWAENGLTLVYETQDRLFTSLLLACELDVIILGMKNGSIRMMLWPIIKPQDEDVEPDWSDCPMHIGPVNYIAIAYSTIFTAGQDSVIVCLSAKQVKEGRIKQLNFKKENDSLNNLSLIPQPTLDFQVEKIQQLHDSIRTLESDGFESEQLDKKYNEKIQDIKISFDKELNKIIEEYNEVVKTIENKEQEFAQAKDEKIFQYQNKTIVQNDKFTRMLNEEFEKYEKLKEEMELSVEKYSIQREEILFTHDEILTQSQQDYENRLKKIMEAYEELQNRVKIEKKKYEAILLQTDVEFEQTIKKIYNKQKEKFDEEKKQAREHLGKHAKLTRDNLAIQKDLQILKEKSVEYSEENKNIEIEKKIITDRLTELEKEMQNREEIIKKKENKIKDLRSLHIHLNNYRFVLDQKITSLKDERAPMEEQNKQIQEHIKKLFSELLEESSTQNATFKLLQTFKLKNTEALNTNNELREELLNTRTMLTQLYSDLAILLEEHDNERLMDKLKDLYYKHVGKEDLYPSDEPLKPTLNELFRMEKEENIEKIKNEKTQQEKFMKTMYKNMNTNKLKLEEEHNRQILWKQQENARLINECYELREEKDRLNRKISDLDAEIKRIRYSMKGGVVPDTIVKVANTKDTPFQEYIKKKIVPPHEIYQPKNKPDFHVRSIIFGLERNRTEYAKQNRKFQDILE